MDLSFLGDRNNTEIISIDPIKDITPLVVDNHSDILSRGSPVEFIVDNGLGVYSIANPIACI